MSVTAEVFRKRAYQKWFAIVSFAAPALILLFIFRLLPLIEAVRIGFYEYSLLSPTMTFIGLNNYYEAFRDPLFRTSLINVAYYVLGKVPIQMALGLALAMAVNRSGWFIPVTRASIFIPVVTSLVIVSTLWLMMYHPSQGILNSLLASVGLPRMKFLIDETQAMPSIILMSIWKDVGFSMIFFLAGLQGIPEELHEAAAIDGAGAWSRFRHITLPLLKGTTLFVLVTETIFAFRVFTPVYLMTHGGPGDATRVVVYYIYERAFFYNAMGYASALSVILLVIILAISLFQMRAIGRPVEY
ncbi:MAG: sugar ABC transporter permease [Chloroflexi bacterium]|nr:sugar ABC transporter permease [Chloroflexota bacterium]MCL5076369.1 sugar ABC transporter permease [Chloroflexota bacterium]